MDEPSTLVQITQAYQKLTFSELVLFLKIRKLPISGSPSDLASRLAQHDLHTYHFCTTAARKHQLELPSKPPSQSLEFPVELIATILEFVGDWELARAVGILTTIPKPSKWLRASSADYAMVIGDWESFRSLDLSLHSPTKIGAITAIRFGYIHILEHFLSNSRCAFRSLLNDDLIPIKASRYGRTEVLTWWKLGYEKNPNLIHPPAAGSIGEAINAACRHGMLKSLDWWLQWGRPLEYTDAALEQASAKNQLAVLDWWLRQNKLSNLPLKIGRVMETASTAGHVQVLEWWAASRLEVKYDQLAMHLASCNGKVNVLQWWLDSGLQVKYDQEALMWATRHNRPDVLEWWGKSGLPVHYRMCDIEEALEEAIGGGSEARTWWKNKGVDFNTNDKEWMKSQRLN